MEKFVYYFSYGSNMCGERMLFNAPYVEKVGWAKLSNFKLAFIGKFGLLQRLLIIIIFHSPSKLTAIINMSRLVSSLIFMAKIIKIISGGMSI